LGSEEENDDKWNLYVMTKKQVEYGLTAFPCPKM
jgi:hypothetical protein